MDIILIHPNDMKAVYGDTLKYVACEPPYWCGIAAQYYLDRGFKVRIIDAEAENMSPEDVAEEVKKQNPALIGVFATGTNLSASTQKMQGVDLTCQAIKTVFPESKIFLWGLHPSALPERTLQESEADYVVKGESLETLVNLLRYVKGEIKFDNQYLGGVYYREKNGLIISTGIGQLLETDKLPLPAWDLLPMNKYMPHNWHIMGETEPEDAKGRYGVISTSIGCPFNCSFCAISSLFGTKKVRFWDVKRVVEEIERLVYEYNIKYIKILDECFVLNKDYINEFCDLLSEKNLDINMWGYARVDTVSPELLKKLRKVGVRWLAYGIESADDETLKGVSKGQYTSNTTLQAMQWTKEADINIIANFMFGLPNDTIRTMDKTLELCKKINPEWINFYVTMCYPGSKDYFDSVKDGYNLSNEWIQYAQYSYECIPAGSKYLSPEEVLRYRDWAFNAFFENNDAYFKLVESKFGIAAVERIKNMTQNKLKRKLLGD